MSESVSNPVSEKRAKDGTRRGLNPNSRRNLIPYMNGENGHKGSGPMVKPALMYFEGLNLAQIRALDPEQLSPGKAIARFRILQAVNEEAWKAGLEDAQFIADRVDGAVVKVEAHASAQATVVNIFEGGRPPNV